VADARADGVRHRDVRDEAFVEERRLAALGEIDELIDDDEGAGREIFFQRADRREREHVGDAELLERRDVRAHVEQRRGNALPAAAAFAAETPPRATPAAVARRRTPAAAPPPTLATAATPAIPAAAARTAGERAARARGRARRVEVSLPRRGRGRAAVRVARA